MEAYKRTLIQDILAKENWQFIVPIYQREYKWTEEECVRLVRDLIKCGKCRKEHFIGSVVYQCPSKNINFSNLKFYLVDGQQRLTTMLLIIKALNLIAQDRVREAKKIGETDSDSLYVFSKTNKILYVDVDDRERGYKIISSKRDKNVFDAIVTAKSVEDIDKNPIVIKSSHMCNNFMRAYSMLSDEIKAGTNIKEDIYEHGMLNLTAVEIVLTYDEDAQEIFESINSLGVPLTNADLIRNYLLMSNENQKAMYTEYWEPMQDTIIGEDNMEDFVQQYLRVKKESTINDSDVYKEYVALAEKRMAEDGISKDDLLRELYEVSLIYETFIKPSRNYTETTNQLMKEFRDMNQSTVYPFLMKVFMDYKNIPDKVSEDTLNKVINLIIVYIVRRTICGAPTNSLRGFMLSLYRRVFKVEDNYNRYYDAIYAYLDQIRTNDYLRSVTEMEAALVKAPIYKNLKFTAYLLFRLENGRYPNIYTESVSAKNPTVEHIMPQTLTDEWIRMLEGDETSSEEIHETYLNTLGNLSLSSRAKNSVMSNEEFGFKKNILKKDGSKFVVLNKDVTDADKFTKDEILSREARLAKLVVEKYNLGDVNTTGIKFDENVEIIAAEEINGIFLGSSPLAVRIRDVEVPVDSFSKIMVQVARYLFKNYPEKIRELAEIGFNPWNDADGAKQYLHFENVDGKDQLVADNIYISTNCNANYCVQFCVLLMKECGLNADELSVYLKKSSIRKENMISKKQKADLVRKALTQLATENVIIYDYDAMPKSDSWIKFQTKGLNELFAYDGTPTNWDGNEKHSSAYYLEYNLAKHRVIITLKRFKASWELSSKFESLKEQLEITTPNSETYWHMKSYDIDHNKVLESAEIDSTDKSVSILSEQLKTIVGEINVWTKKAKQLIETYA